MRRQLLPGQLGILATVTVAVWVLTFAGPLARAVDLRAAAANAARWATEPDPLLENQWHLKERALEISGANVRAVWPFSKGAGVVIGVVDDGLQWTHPDLQPNYLASASFDFNSNDGDPSPSAGDSHGTSAAGVAAARDDNGVGVAGAAPLAQVAGLRLIAAPTSDAQEANALNHLPGVIQVSSNSWGASDDGDVIDGPGPLTILARESAATTGRQGKGVVFVWAAGNGRENADDCNFDGYANSRFVIAVGALDEFGAQAYYSESCSALMVTAPSGGLFGSRRITTTTLGGYTSDFSGTSAATPLVSGAAALMLARNASLTWRDVQHILRRSSVRVNPTDSGWTDGAFSHNEKFGFGLLDAKAAADLAVGWVNVPPEEALTPVVRTVNVVVPDNNSSGVHDTITIPESESNFVIEHVEVEFNATHAYRGDLQVTLSSPLGVVSKIAPMRSDSGDNFSSWRFMSVRHWGEAANGDWRLKVADLAGSDVGTWNSWTLRIYGYHVPDAPLGPFNLLSPSNGAVNQPTNPTLSWTASSGATGYEYCVRTLNQKVCNWTPVGNVLSATPTGLLPGTRYFWQVRATSPNGLQRFSGGLPGPNWIFDTQPAPPGPFVKSGPSSGATNQPTNLTLSWTSSSGATSYTYCIDTTNDNTCSVSSWRGTASTSVVPTDLSPGTQYYWQVWATSPTGGPTPTYANGSSTAFWSFATGSAPGAFNKSAPANGSFTPSGVTLSWTASSAATSYEYCYDTSNDGACAAWLSAGTSQSVVLSGLSPFTPHYWQVRANTANGSLTYANGALGVFWNFISPPSSGLFNKTAPSNGATNQPANLTLTWGSSSSATTYEYCYDTTNDGACTTWLNAGSGLSANVNGLSPSTVYFWQVRASNGSAPINANGGFWSFSTAPAGPNVVQNSSFDGALAGWQPFALPDSSYLVTNVSDGVLQFYRNAPPEGMIGQGVVLQQTGVPVVADGPLAATFDVGNSSPVRKRLSVLIHDQDFSDLSVCTFWLPANAPLRTYRMVAHTTEAWIGATISFYAATAGSDGGFYLLDNVSLAHAPTESADETTCVDPTAPLPSGVADGPELLGNGGFDTNTTQSWIVFGTITQQVTAGVFEFFRPAGEPAGTILQPTGQAVAPGEIVSATFELGNSSNVRKRVTVILHDFLFTDLSACTFWLEPGQALSPYAIRTFATAPWTNATLSIYPANVGTEQWIRFDNASLKRRPSLAIPGTACLEPGSDAGSGVSGFSTGGHALSLEPLAQNTGTFRKARTTSPF